MSWKSEIIDSVMPDLCKGDRKTVQYLIDWIEMLNKGHVVEIKLSGKTVGGYTEYTVYTMECTKG